VSVAVAAVVVTKIETVVVFGVPFAAMVAGEKVQVVSEGKPEQPILIVPLNPVELDTATDVVPEDPGAETTTPDWEVPMAA
jgi:hypothetical protein